MLLTIFSFIIVLGILVFIHEFGHYLAAKLSGIRVEEFAIGFGPKLLSYQRGETLYSIRGIPLGGFCKMTGEFPPDDEMSAEEKEIYYDAREKEECFDQKSVWKRFAVVFNGPFMNFVLAIFIFALIFNIFGLPVRTTNSNILGDIIPGQPAAQAGFKVGDRVYSIDGQSVETWDELADIIHRSSGKELIVGVERDEELIEIEVTPRYEESAEGGVIGIAPQLLKREVGLLESFRLGFGQSWYIFKVTVLGFFNMITGKTPAEIGGPVMIASMIGQAAEIGISSVLNLMAVLSINLGIINLVPFPALDGGRIIFIFVELIRGKPVNPEKESFVHIVGFILLIVLMVFLVFKDIGRTIF
ncbi:RIP metalloprotease RseP [Halocella sp. SP3-1]|uniref:RIP metalloprotease RseP n=1 Tax=Halocella sp. SP3-1 TaxID=2382161 RepID=UPI000F74E390|nr:RIP metalloprotease RseP [Halocella sp. SP3-1]AZO95549.1 RIP metalloprotease RseP [Halocella sp. SP3-1]